MCSPLILRQYIISVDVACINIFCSVSIVEKVTFISHKYNKIYIAKIFKAQCLKMRGQVTSHTEESIIWIQKFYFLLLR